MPSLLLVALRYLFTAIPAVFFIKKPKTKWKYIIAYGLTIGAGQFGCLFYALEIGMPASIASFIVHCQAFFTFIFAAIILKEKPTFYQLAGISVAAVGLFMVIISAGTSVMEIDAVPFLLTLVGAAFWGIANIVVRKASEEAKQEGENINMLSLVVWSSLFSPIVLLGAALLVDPLPVLVQAIIEIDLFEILVILYQAGLANIFGFGIWSRLIAKYSASEVAPMSLLAPVFALISSVIILKEVLIPEQWIAGILVISGVFITNLKKKPKLLQRN